MQWQVAASDSGRMHEQRMVLSGMRNDRQRRKRVRPLWHQVAEYRRRQNAGFVPMGKMGIGKKQAAAQCASAPCRTLEFFFFLAHFGVYESSQILYA